MKINNFIKVVWQLPQYILGYVISKTVNVELYTQYQDAVVYTWKIKRGLSLGRYIFIPFDNGDPMSDRVLKYIKHEYGHTIQSKYLGWLYLIIVGLPSAVWASCFEWYRNKNNVSYYSFYTEKLADKLGGVIR